MDQAGNSIAYTPLAIVVMGVSGSGKSTIGVRLARELGCAFLEGDQFHNIANVEKMRAGYPLNDEDRWPWLDSLGVAAGALLALGEPVVIACSALKRIYRRRLEARFGAPVLFVLLETDAGELARRIGARPEHYMPESLLKSQLDTLERPDSEEYSVTLDAAAPVADLCGQIHAFLRSHNGEPIAATAHRVQQNA